MKKNIENTIPEFTIETTCFGIKILTKIFRKKLFARTINNVLKHEKIFDLLFDEGLTADKCDELAKKILNMDD